MLQRRHEEDQASVGRKGFWFRKPERVEEAVSEAQQENVLPEKGTPQTPLSLLHQAIAARNRALRRVTKGAGLLGVGTLAGALTTAQVENFHNALPALLLIAGVILSGDTLMVTSLLWGERACRKAVSELANCDEMEAIGPLAEALTLWDPSHSLAVSALIRLLPRLQHTDLALFTPVQIACLRRAFRQSSDRKLFWRYNPHFAAILQRALTRLDLLPQSEQNAEEEPAVQHPAQVEALLEQFQAAVRQRQKNTTLLGVTTGLSALSAIGNIAAQALPNMHGNTPLLGVAIGTMAMTLATTFRGLVRLKAMMNELANAGDLRVVGPLLDIAALHEGSGNTTAVFLLMRLLPRLKASDADLLTSDQQEALAHTLTRYANNPDYLVAALAALEQIGDGRALPLVEGIAEGRIKTGDPQRVRTAAQECLPYLQMRNEARQASQTLLRASGLSDTSPANLLRPVQGVVPTEQSELLRPGTPRPEGESERPHHDMALLPSPRISFAAPAI